MKQRINTVKHKTYIYYCWRKNINLHWKIIALQQNMSMDWKNVNAWVWSGLKLAKLLSTKSSLPPSTQFMVIDRESDQQLG